MRYAAVSVDIRAVVITRVEPRDEPLPYLVGSNPVSSVLWLVGLAGHVCAGSGGGGGGG